MANSASAKKRIRQTARQTQVNRTRVSAIRSAVRKVEEAITSGDKAAAQAALQAAQPLLARGAQNNVMSRNTASRKLSRLSHRIKGMAA
ncbi:MAG: 30S ribosomal protein S20 [Rhodospirillales bacterium]|nr:30S ribosomal protein S20 [Rhodospirillales bacterium]MBO6788530.1 30S ribosomal protein S20 [Rhodospirillales bacterium]